MRKTLLMLLFLQSFYTFCVSGLMTVSASVVNFDPCHEHVQTSQQDSCDICIESVQCVREEKAKQKEAVIKGALGTHKKIKLSKFFVSFLKNNSNYLINYKKPPNHLFAWKTVCLRT